MTKNNEDKVNDKVLKEYQEMHKKIEEGPIAELRQEYNTVLHQTNMELSGVQKQVKELQAREEALVANKERLEGALGAFADLHDKLYPKKKQKQG